MSRLDAIAGLARDAGADAVAEDARELAARVADRRFHVACVGQFKRGKSTLLNALVGDALLPAGVLPVTAVVTVLRHGPRQVRIRVESGWREIPPATLAEWVTEAQNPGNAKGVRGVEVLAPSPLLASGMCLVDTPGLGSIFAANTAATRAFVPHVDASLVVLGADPPISGEELALVEAVGREVRHLVVVLNKADRLSDADNAEAARFAERVLTERLGGPVGPIFQVSATQRLAGTGPARDWDAMVAALRRLSGDAASVLAGAEERGTGRLLDRLAAELAEQRGALERPRAGSERRIAALRGAVAEAERALGDLGHLFRAEEERLERAYGEWRDRFLARPALAATPATRDEARAAAHDALDAWRRETEPAAEELYAAAAARFVELANGFVARLREVSGLEGLPDELPARIGFGARPGFHFNDLPHVSLPGPLATRQRRERAAAAFLRRLLETNSARVMNDWRDRVLESRRQLEAELRARLRALVTSAERALERAAAVHAAGAEATAAALAQVHALEQRAVALRTRR